MFTFNNILIPSPSLSNPHTHTPLNTSPQVPSPSNIFIPFSFLSYPHTSSPRYPRPASRSPPPVTAWGLKASAAISPNMTQVCPMNIVTKSSE